MQLLAIDWIFILEKFILVGFIISLSLFIAMYTTYFERKIAAWLQDRRGPNRAGLWGILQPLADGGKLFFMEEYSWWYPKLSSFSASGKSNGVRLHSAKAHTKNIKNPRGWYQICQLSRSPHPPPCWLLTITLICNEPVINNSAISVAKYGIICMNSAAIYVDIN